jgi:hypothetical protein
MSAHRVLLWSENSLSALRTPEACLHASECTPAPPGKIKVAFGGGAAGPRPSSGGSRVEFTFIAIRSTRARGVEGCIRATDDDVLIIDSTPSW